VAQDARGPAPASDHAVFFTTSTPPDIATVRDLQKRARRGNLGCVDRHSAAGLDTTGLPIDVFIVSDHGMLEVQQSVSIGREADFKDFEIAPQDGSQIMLYSANQKLAAETVERLRMHGTGYEAYLRKDTPEHLHYRDNWRIGDIVVMANAPVNLHIDRPGVVPEQERGNHGYDPKTVSRDARHLLCARSGSERWNHTGGV